MHLLLFGKKKTERQAIIITGTVRVITARLLVIIKGITVEKEKEKAMIWHTKLSSRKRGPAYAHGALRGGYSVTLRRVPCLCNKQFETELNCVRKRGSGVRAWGPYVEGTVFFLI